MNCDLCGGPHETYEHYELMGEIPQDASDTEVEYITEGEPEIIDMPPSQEGGVESHYTIDNQETQSYPGGAEYIPQPEMPAQSMPPGYEHPMYDQVKPPTTKGAIAQDFMKLAQAASSGDAGTILSAMEQFSKSQLVRFLDVSVLGPLMLFWAWRGKLSKTERMMLGLIGAGTIVYNGRNYLRNKKVIQPKELQAIKTELVSSKLSGG